MSDRPIANEAACPIPLERLSLMLRSERQDVEALALTLPDAQRAALAAFCYNRQHLRDLAYLVAPLCSQRSLLAAAGTAGLVLYDQSQEARSPSDQPSGPRPKAVSLARRA